nr:DUF167 family protein [uncultured Methanoregula sp.]
MPDIADAVTENPKGTVIAIEVTANAKTAVFPDGYNPWRNAIGCRVPAEAVDGKANKAILRLVAKTLEIPQSAVSIQSGALASQKKIQIAGLSRSAVLERLQAHS